MEDLGFRVRWVEVVGLGLCRWRLQSLGSSRWRVSGLGLRV